MEERETKHTPGKWSAHTMIDDDGKPMSPEAMGDYVRDAMVASALASGESLFWFVSGTHDDGRGTDVAHVGNGARSKANARLIAAAPDMLAALEAIAGWRAEDCIRREDVVAHARAAITRATGGSDADN